MKTYYWVALILFALVAGYGLGVNTKECPTDSTSESAYSVEGERDNSENYKNNDSEIPDRVFVVLAHIRTHNKAPKDHVGGRKFYNREKRLPLNETYREWDVHPKRPGKNRGAERIVTSPTRAYYTADHYDTFILIPEE